MDLISLQDKELCRNDKEDEEELRVTAAVRGKKIMTTCALWIILKYSAISTSIRNLVSCLVQTFVL